jgi:hypothetical protein
MTGKPEVNCRNQAITLMTDHSVVGEMAIFQQLPLRSVFKVKNEAK